MNGNEVKQYKKELKSRIQALSKFTLPVYQEEKAQLQGKLDWLNSRGY